MTHTTASIPVDLKSPGQVLACMGFLEAAEVLLEGVEAHFDWSETQATFVLRADGDKNPFEVVLEFLAKARVIELTPVGYVEGGAADGDADDDGGEDATPSEPEDDKESDDGDASDAQGRVTAPSFPAGEGDRNALPIQLVAHQRRICVSHWAEHRKPPARPWLLRDAFKLYTGNRSAKSIATQMLQSARAKNRGLQQIWKEQREALLKAPFDVLTPMGGSFNFDPRGAWTAIDAGYSPNTQKDGIAASPVVEILAAIGLEHARPDQYETRKVRYAVWGRPLPPSLARAALARADLKVPMRRFQFELDLSGKNKVTTFAQEETQP
jgi:CRISPR-associated protein Csx14